MKKIRLLFMFAAMMCTATSAWALSGTGTSTNAFSGTFDGNGYTITIALNTTAEYTGLFRYVGSGTIKNLHVAGTFIGLGTSDYDAIFVRNSDDFTGTDCFYVNTVGKATSISASEATRITTSQLSSCLAANRYSRYMPRK